MCSYLLGIWVQEEITPPLPLPPPAGHLGPQNRRHLRRHHLNKSPLNDDNDQSESDETATEATITTKETQTDNEDTAPSSSSPSSSSLSSSSFKLFVANSLTPLDGAMISLIRERLEVGNTLRLHPLLSWLFGYRSMRRRPTAGSGGVGLSGAATALELSLDDAADAGKTGLLVFPEMTSTNGKAVVSFEEKLVCCRKAAMSVKTSTMLTSEEEVHRNVPEDSFFIFHLDVDSR